MHTETEQAFIREVWALQGTSYIVVALRYYSKFSILGWQSLAWDDAMMLLATVFYTAESVMAYCVVAYWKGLANNAMTDAYRESLDPNSREWYLRVGGSKSNVAGLIIYATLLWLLKACWLVYYARLTEGVNNMRSMIRWGVAIIGLSYIACLLVAFLKCIPFDHQWQINPSPGNNCMPAISTLQTIFVMVMNTLTDFYIMAIPLPLVWKAHLPWRKKFVLLFMFGGGFLEMAFGILRCVSILTVSFPPPIYLLGDIDPAQSGYWSVRESFVCVVLTNLPMVYALFSRYIEKGVSAARSKGDSGVGIRGYRLSSLRSRGATIGQKQRPPGTDPNDTAWDSEEYINAEGVQGRSIDSEESFLNLPKHQAVGVAFDESGIPGGAAQPTNGTRQIMVTTEYTVTEGARHDSRDINKAGFIG
ncbi:uncharacterized protein F4812DRAFT_461514 [Daldinia caldariorum]|uniref:uncharacterized protein n=1 Tax=Daldinia caldariorum TaxID=326644 RepID=UPI002007DB97|nr:uncharacterized protein F4812DRAFT_461514 [Daldinia caldariorum]KAI1465825.1 hypothetical protein F4812DRAFT_461514 [Daldinia caldariorum]